MHMRNMLSPLRPVMSGGPLSFGLTGERCHPAKTPERGKRRKEVSASLKVVERLQTPCSDHH